MQECTLRFPEIVKTKLVDKAIGDRPVVTQVPLLVAFRGIRAEVQHGRATGLKTSVGIEKCAVVKVVVDVQALAVIDAMVNFRSELIGSIFVYSRNGLKRAVGSIRQRDVLIHEVDSDGIHAFNRDLVIRKDVSK